jgi:aminoglycoside phosphotransferase (APT) family kinase protein
VAPALSIVRGISRRSGATVAEGLFGGARAAVKVFSSEAGFNRECGALAAAAATGAPVPALLWAGRHDGRLTMVQEWIEGIPGLTALRASRGGARLELAGLAAATHAGMCRAALEAAPRDFGFMAHVGGVSAGHGDWPGLLGSQVEKWLSRLRPATLGAIGGAGAMETLVARARGAPNDLRTVVHCDYLFRNLIVRPCGTAVVIDFGTALAGDPRYDLAKMVWSDLDARGELARHFVRTWTEHSRIEAPGDLLDLYVSCHCLAAMAWVDRKASPRDSDSAFRHLAMKTFIATARSRR